MEYSNTGITPVFANALSNISVASVKIRCTRLVAPVAVVAHVVGQRGAPVQHLVAAGHKLEPIPVIMQQSHGHVIPTLVADGLTGLDVLQAVVEEPNPAPIAVMGKLKHNRVTHSLAPASPLSGHGARVPPVVAAAHEVEAIPACPVEQRRNPAIHNRVNVSGLTGQCVQRVLAEQMERKAAQAPAEM